ncbi:MAG: RNA polymerase sigma factor [Ruminococcaceae bacterium]|nr:RNA polymerase sigma factor [Oscillospiraceae bacterium]
MISLIMALVEAPQNKLLIEKLYKQYEQDMYRITYAILKSKTEAEDAVAEAFIRIIRNSSKIDVENTSKTKAFMLIVAKNTALSRYCELKREMRFTESLEGLSENLPDIHKDMLSRVNTEHIFEMIKEIGSYFYDIMFLQCKYGYSDTEISDITGLTEVNIRQIKSRGKRKLVEKMKKEGMI